MSKRFAWLALAALAATVSSCTAGESLEGVISDARCGGTHEWDEHGPPLTERECTLMCVKKGAPFVLVSAGRVYTISNQDHPALTAHAGEMVHVNGRVQGDTVAVASIATR